MKKAIFPKITFSILIVMLALSIGISACDQTPQSDQLDKIRQEKLLLEAQAEVGMPAITKFAEKKLLKYIYELRDNPQLATHTYAFNEFNGKYIYIGPSIGFPVPYGTQYSNPTKVVGASQAPAVIAQAEPNALFVPSTAEASWVVLVSESGKPEVTYFEQRICARQSQMPARLVQKD